MTPSQLSEAGNALYGPRWRSELARTLGVDRKTLYRWASGAWPVPEAQARLVRAMLAGKANGLARLCEKLAKGA